MPASLSSSPTHSTKLPTPHPSISAFDAAVCSVRASGGGAQQLLPMRHRLQGMAHRVTGSLRSSMEFRCAAFTSRSASERHSCFSIEERLQATMRHRCRRLMWKTCWKRVLPPSTIPQFMPAALSSFNFSTVVFAHWSHSLFRYSERLLQIMQRKMNQSNQ